MKPTHIATVALLITALAVPMASASTGLNTTPEANETDANETADAVEQVETAVDSETDRTPIPTPPPDSQFADTPTPNQSEPKNGERIEQGLILLNSSYSGGGETTEEGGEWGTITLTLKASQTKAVTLYDAGSFILGGESPKRVLDPFEGTKTFEFRAYRPSDSGYVGVTIQTTDTRYNEPIEVGASSGPDLPTLPAALGILMGIAVVVVAMVGLDRYLSDKERWEVQRIDG